jgi:SAM-dependent methyltransferase
MPAVSVQLRRLFQGLRTEGAGAGRETAAVALGVFIGCLPLYGLHLAICWIVGFVLGLNRLKMYFAANVSNPFVAPWLVFAEVQVGAWVRRGSFHPVTREYIASTGLTVFGVDALVGSLFVGPVLGLLAAWGTYSLVRASGEDRPFADLVRRASDRYVGTSITAWEFARGKLRMDPIYRSTLSPDVLPSGGTLLDVGCGQGLALALLVEARNAVEHGAWPAQWPLPPRFDRLVGIEIRKKMTKLARAALKGDADIIDADVRALPLAPARAVLLFDVLQLLPPEDQESLLANLAARLDAGGAMIVREADASAGWRFTAVRLGNRFKLLVSGHWRQPFHPRTEAGWRALFARSGFAIESKPMGKAPFANVMFRLTAAAASAPAPRPSPAA